MTYQVIASPRTGSTILNRFAVEDNGLGFSEFFNEDVDINLDWHKGLFKHYSIEEKLDYLEFYKAQDIHFSLKLFPHQVLISNPQVESRLIKFFDGYKNLTINRDPWDSFLSLMYQHYTNWEIPHKHGDEQLETVEFTIDLTWVKEFVKIYKVNKNFVSKISVYKEFNYDEEISLPDLQKFFKTYFDPVMRKMQLDYKSKAINIKEAKEMFDYEMYGTGNRNNN